MNAIDFITELFCKVDDALSHVRPEYETQLHLSEIVTIGLLYALKGKGPRPFYRWLTANHKAMFPQLPECICQAESGSSSLLVKRGRMGPSE